MKVLSHRGFWNEAIEQNSKEAFLNSFCQGFGTETDVRDLGGELVISHDMPNGRELKLKSFLELIESYQTSNLTLAINIKADGLAEKLHIELSHFTNIDFFVFDMSIPDMRAYFEAGLPVFTRMSEVEHNPVWLEKSSGIWLDLFDNDWYDSNLVGDLLLSGKRVCIVSPELHGRNHISHWEKIFIFKDHPKLMICTDFPLEAKNYFNGRG